ncbi:unnamed protein product [Phaedon cochleariae]|uniref:WD repeat-containing protein 63 n=1 Tax=Phaedon cochleariae TaxID=80249 RepID=A0A9N9SKK7_PHACE|nr:unnamed protein product [Phaedon cochleariae]
MSSPDTISKSSKKRKKRKKLKHKDIFDIPGVRKLTLSELAQKIIGCVAGEHVTAESPWMYVNKEKIQDNLELHEESSEFLPLKKELIEYPRRDVLIGYIPDESREYEEFYICVTEEATETVKNIIEKMKEEQEERLYNTVNKSIKKWFSQGTEEEVDESIIKNNRALLEVEVESQYPIFSPEVQFTTVKAEQRRDGYMELRYFDDQATNVLKKRIDAHTQVAPQNISSEVQTICTYPSNSATQYRYEIKNVEELLNKCTKNIISYTEDNYDHLSELLRVNGAIDLYTDDYSALISNDSRYMKATAMEEVKEYMFFMDVNLCEGKMIADAVWHPMWSGTVAIAYADVAPNIYNFGQNTEDTVLKAVHGINPVLIWSCLDGLKPKLILEAPREVHKLSFCKFDENILIGGCKNGQIIIWDIRNKLHKVEELEILTTAQQKYRVYMHSLMKWMRNIHDVSVVRPTAISDLGYSHKGPVTGISWVSPYYEYSKIGNLMEIPEDWSDPSMQLITGSEDGTILIWDLLKKPTIQAGGFKPRQLKRLKKRPSALMVDVSPYHSLHLNLKPLYKINMNRKDNKKNFAISNFHSNSCHMEYEEINPDKNRKNVISERILFKPIFRRESQQALKQEMHVGTSDGHYIHLKWEGQEYDTGEIVNCENAKIIMSAKYHDGPVNTVEISDFSNITLTVGGRIFALWRDDFSAGPILWRRCKHMYTTGEWDIFKPYMVINKIMNGDVESWAVSSSSKFPVSSLTYSSQFLTASAIHPRKLKRNIYGAGDKQGSFRLFFVPEDTIPLTEEMKRGEFLEFVDREIDRKKQFLSWQEAWNKKNASVLKVREDEQREFIEKEEATQKEKEQEKQDQKVDDKTKQKGPQPGKYVEWVIEQRKLEEAARIKSTIISKKQLDTKELEKRRKPLQKLDEENERKKRKQKQRLREGETIFRETIASLFPEIVKEKPAPPPDPYAGGEPADERERCYYDYLEITQEAEDFKNSHPYYYDFDWKQVLTSGEQRRRLLDEAYSSRKHPQLGMKSTSSKENYVEQMEGT